MPDEPLFITGAEKGEKKGSAESSEVFDMIKRITVHVLSEAGMGTKVPWRGSRDGEEKPEPGFDMTYIKACKVIMESVTGSIVIPTKIFLNWRSWFPMHTKALHVVGQGNIMSQLL